MAGDWERVALGEVAINHDARRIPVKEADRKPGKYPYYGASGIVDYVDDYLFDGEYLLVAEDGENLRTRQTPITFMAKGRFWVNNHAHILEGSAKVLTRFLHYALLAADIQPYLTGAVMPKLTQANLHRIPLMLPPKEEQENIVALLGALDDKIELNRRMAETLEAMARALFRSWFVDFDPVRAKAEGRPTGLPDDLAALFPDRFGEDGLPTGWKQSPLSDFATVDRETVEPADLSQTPVSYYSIPAFDSGRRPASEIAVNIKSLKLLVRAPRVLMSKLNPEIPRIWPILQNDERPMLASTEFINFGPNRDRTTLAFLTCLLYSEPFCNKASPLVTGTSKSHQRLQTNALLSTTWPHPPRPLIDAFDSKANLLLVRLEQTRKESDTLAALRDTLLPKLISGELRIAEAEQRLAAAG